MQLIRLAVLPLLIGQLVLLPVLAARPAGAAGAPPLPPPTLRDYLRMPYLKLFELSPELRFTAAEIEAERKALARREDSCAEWFKGQAKQYDKQLAGVSWFRTHPPFYQRMVEAEREIIFLPKKEHLVVQTSAFEQMKKELAPISAQAEKKSKQAPSLIAPLKGKCPAPDTVYKPGQDIEVLCAQ